MSQIPVSSNDPGRADRQGSNDREGRATQAMPAVQRGGAVADAVMDTNPETDLWTGRTHWLHFSGRLFLWAALNIVMLCLLVSMSGAGKTMAAATAFWIELGFVVVSTVFLGARPLLTIFGTRYRLTSQRLFIERGILSKTIDQSELMRVDDVRLQKSLFDRVFGLGSVSIVSTDATDREIVLPGISGSEQVAESIRQRMRKLRQKTLFVETL